MTEEKMIEVKSKIYDALNDEQKAQVKKCKTTNEFTELAEDLGIAIPDELLAGVSGGCDCHLVQPQNQFIENILYTLGQQMQEQEEEKQNTQEPRLPNIP